MGADVLGALPSLSRRCRDQIAGLCERIERHEGACLECGKATGMGAHGGRKHRCDEGQALFDELSRAAELYIEAIDHLCEVDTERLNLHVDGPREDDDAA
jgi:hypothetical protein